MNFINEYLNKIKIKREQKEKRKRDILAEFELFVKESRPLAPRAKKNPEAAVYRYIWKRAYVLEKIFENIPSLAKETEYLKEFQEKASKEYYKIAPQNAYGTVRLSLSVEAHKRMRAEELDRLNPSDEIKTKRNIQLACIYIGYDSENKKPYVGQTIGDPEFRWKEHRMNGTGPYKKGALYADWKIIMGNVALKELDEHESFYIGYFNSYEDGHNDTKGNNWQAYERGIRSREES